MNRLLEAEVSWDPDRQDVSEGVDGLQEGGFGRTKADADALDSKLESLDLELESK